MGAPFLAARCSLMMQDVAFEVAHGLTQKQATARPLGLDAVGLTEPRTVGITRRFGAERAGSRLQFHAVQVAFWSRRHGLRIARGGPQQYWLTEFTDRPAELPTEPAWTATEPAQTATQPAARRPRPAEIRRRHPRPPDRIALMSQRTEHLLAAVDRLSYPHRMRELASAARRAAAEGAVDELVTGLAAHGVHGRRLAATLADMVRHDAYLEGCLADPDRLVRAPAIRALRQGRLTDAAVIEVIEDAPAAVRQQLVHAIAVAGRTTLAEALVEPTYRRWGAEAAAELLSACTAETAARLLPRLFRGLSSYRLLAARHPALLLAEMERQLDTLPAVVRDGWLASHADALALLAEPDPLGVLAVLERHETLPMPVHRKLHLLVEADPGRTVRLLLRPKLRSRLNSGHLEPAVLRRLVRHAPAELTDLACAWNDNAAALARLLACLPPSRRGTLFDAAMEGKDLAHADLSPALLDVLPYERRTAEARRMATLARGRGAHWTRILTAAAYLPPDEVRDDLLTAVRRSDADDRATAYPLLVRNAARSRDPQEVSRLLRALLRLRNEQDPVRSAALSALAEVRPSLFAEDAAEDLGRIAIDAVEAHDSSWSTRHALSTLALSVLREHAVTGGTRLIGWALDTLTQLSGHTGGANVGRLDTVLRRGQEYEVLAALRPWLEAATDKADYSLVFALVRALGRRAWGMAELQEYLWQAVRFGNDASVRTAVDLWLEQPKGRDERVERIVRLEPSAAVLPSVLRVLTGRRTDLLDPVLADTPPYGRFLTARSHWTPPTYRAHRWVPRQQRAAAELLARTRRGAAGACARPGPLRGGSDPGGGPGSRPPLHGIVERAAGGGGPRRTAVDRPPRRGAAAAAGARGRRPRPGRGLRGNAGRAVRRAVAARHGAPQAAHAEGPADGEGHQPQGGGAPRGDDAAPPPQAAPSLREAFELPGQHHDVQSVCVAFAQGMLAEPAIWPMLESAAQGRTELRRELARAAVTEVDEEHRARYAGLLRRACEPLEPETAAALFPALAEWAPWQPEIAEMLVAATTDLADRAVWAMAGQELVEIAADDDGPYLRALRAMLEATGDPDQPDAEPERDQPARQRAASLLQHLLLHHRYRGGGRPTADVLLRAADTAAGHEDFARSVTELRLYALELDKDATALSSGLGRLAADCEGRPLLARDIAEGLSARLSAISGPAPGAWWETARTLGAEPGLAQGLFAIRLTVSGGSRSRWTEPWRGRLRTLRRHAHPDVRASARETVTAREAPRSVPGTIQW